MAKCDYCNSTIIFGGKQYGHLRFCNDKCFQAGQLVRLAEQIDPGIIQRQIGEVHAGKCPRCGGRGPVDVHKAHRVWSALVLTSWSSSPELSCKGCATRRQLGAILFSGALGWWGFPWGIIFTPVQVIRNMVEMAGGPSPAQPSPLLERIVRMHAAATLAQGRNTPPIPR
jgi:hypothetical protein